MANPEYTSYWRDCAADQWFEKPSRIVPALHVHGIWDQEDIYGSPAVYAALEKHDEGNGLNFFAAGPWYHGQHFANGSSLGSIQFDEDTAKRFRQDLLKPFLDHFLKGNGTEPVIEPVTVFETGGNRWREFKEWPPAARVRKLYLHDGGGLSFETPVKNQSSSKYVSDPQKPVPYAPRPIWGFNYGVPSIIAKWRTWLVEDQRFVDGRPDVLTWISEPLDKDVTIRGPVTAKLFAETTGTDADWVVKLIDVYPDEDPVSFEMSGFQLMVSGDIFRGRYREDYSKAKPIQPNTALEYEIPMPTVNHTFRAGHRMMVQVQSTWFPLYDRNPQTFVDSIMEAPDSSFQTQTHRIHHDRSHPTHIEFLVDE
jgi:putative CocE/NonD family hydrolase